MERVLAENLDDDSSAACLEPPPPSATRELGRSVSAPEVRVFQGTILNGDGSRATPQH